MKLAIDTFINIHINIPCLILGPSPNMSNFNFDTFNGKIFTIGDTIIRGNKLFKADYWIASNNEFPLPHYHYNLINSLKATLIFSDSALYDNLWTKNDAFLNDNLKINWSCYDERHFQHKECFPKKKCCDLLKDDPNRKTIQEILSNFFDSKFVVPQGNTVAEYALCIALIMGCNPIYIQGIELPLNHKDYIYYPSKEADRITIDAKNVVSNLLRKKEKKISLSLIKKINHTFSSIFIEESKLIHYPANFVKTIFSKNTKSVFANDLDGIIDNFDNYAAISSKRNVEIFNLSKESNLNKCKNIGYLDYKKV